MRVWRIATAAHVAFDGEGARRYGSRWTSKGFPVVYASATLSLAALERFLHADPDMEPTDLVAVSVDIDDDIRIEALEIRRRLANWRKYPAPEGLARFGDEWLRASRTAILAVPSAVIPHERNYVLNPAHADFRRLVIGRPEPFSFDPRMWAKRTSR